MTDRIPLVLNSGQIQQVQAADGIAVKDVTINDLNRNSSTYGADTKLFTGVPWDERIKFKIAVSYSAPNVVVSLSFNSPYTSFSYYINGKKYTVTDLTPFTNQTATAAEGIFFVYISNSNVFTITQTPWLIYNPDVLLWNFYFNATNNIIEWIGEERHTAGRDIFNHARMHAQGAIYKSGFAFSQYNGLAATSYASNTDNNFGRAMAQFSGGSFFDEDILNNIAHTDTSISATTTNPATDWNLTVNQFLGFTALAAAGTTTTSIVFPSTHTLVTGQAVCVMVGNSTTVRGTTSITTGGTGTTFAVPAVTGMTTGDAIVIGGRIRMYYISSLVGSLYTWRRISATSFLGVTTAAATWTRSGSTITVTFANHGEQTGNVITVTVSSDTGAIPLKVYSVTLVNTSTFQITGVATGASSGTLTYNNTYNTVTIPNGVAQYNNPAGGFSPMTANRYFCVYIIATNITSEPLIAVLCQGQSSNATLATALSEAAFQFQNLVGLSTLDIQEVVPLYRLTYQYGTAGGFSNSRIRLVDATFINIRIATATATVINPSVTTLPASQITNDVTNFNKNLSAADTTVQHALDTIDDLTISAPFETDTANIKMNGTVSVGALSTYPRADHVHPTDTSLSSLPVGAMTQYSGFIAPSASWLFCDGSSVSKTTYSTLFGVITSATRGSGGTGACTFTDTGDVVTMNGHAFSTGDCIYFATIVTTTGIAINTNYYVIYVNANTFYVASTYNLAMKGTKLALTSDGTGTIIYCPFGITDASNFLIPDLRGASIGGGAEDSSASSFYGNFAFNWIIKVL